MSMWKLYEIIFNIVILLGVFFIFKKIYNYLANQAEEDTLFLSLDQEYITSVRKYSEYSLPKFIYLYAYQKKKEMVESEVISDENVKTIDTVNLMNEIKSYIYSPDNPFFFYRKKFNITKSNNVNFLIQEIRDAMEIKFPNENQVAIIIVNDDILYFVHEPENFYVGSSDKISQLLKEE